MQYPSNLQYQHQFKKPKIEDNNTEFMENTYERINTRRTSQFMWKRRSEIDVSCFNISIAYDIDRMYQITLPELPEYAKIPSIIDSANPFQITKNEQQTSDLLQYPEFLINIDNAHLGFPTGSTIRPAAQQSKIADNDEFVNDVYDLYLKKQMQKEQEVLFKKENTLIEEFSPIKTKIKNIKKNHKQRINSHDETNEIQTEKSKYIRPKQNLTGVVYIYQKWHTHILYKQERRKEKYNQEEFKKLLKQFCRSLYVPQLYGNIDFLKSSKRCDSFKLTINPHQHIGPCKLYKQISCHFTKSNFKGEELYYKPDLSQAYVGSKFSDLDKQLFFYNNTERPIEVYLCLDKSIN